MQKIAPLSKRSPARKQGGHTPANKNCQQTTCLKMIFIVEGTGLLAILLQYTEISSMIGKKIEVKTKDDFKRKVNEFDKKNTVVVVIHAIKPGESTKNKEHLETVHDIRAQGFLKVQSCNVAKKECNVMASKIRGYIINRAGIKSA